MNIQTKTVSGISRCRWNAFFCCLKRIEKYEAPTILSRPQLLVSPLLVLVLLLLLAGQHKAWHILPPGRATQNLVARHSSSSVLGLLPDHCARRSTACMCLLFCATRCNVLLWCATCFSKLANSNSASASLSEKKNFNLVELGELVWHDVSPLIGGRSTFCHNMFRHSREVHVIPGITQPYTTHLLHSGVRAKHTEHEWMKWNESPG